MRWTRLVLYREVFLTYVLSNQPITIAQRLQHRFPVTRNNRDQAPFYKHMFFQKPLILDEYRLNFAYCLFESANQNEDVLGVLFNELYKKGSKLYREVKNKYARNTKIGIPQLKLFINERKLELRDMFRFNHRFFYRVSNYL